MAIGTDRNRFWPVVMLVVLGVATAHAAEESTPQAAVRDFNAAAALQNSGFYDRAGEKWIAFLAAYPGDPRLDRAQHYLGICQLHAKKYIEAAKTFQTVLDKYPKFDNLEAVRYNLGMALFQAASDSKRGEDFRKAAQALGAVAAQHAQGKFAARALYFQGEALVAAGDLRTALEPYRKVVAQYAASPVAADAQYALGTTHQELKQETEAAATFAAFLANKAWEKHELAHEVRLRLAIVRYDQKNYAEAEPLFAAVASVPGFAQADFALLRQGQCRLEMNRPADAAPLLAGLSQKHPQSSYKGRAQLTAGKCYWLAGRFDDAQRTLSPLAQQQQPESAEAAYWLGRTLLKLHKPQEALSGLERATQTLPAGEFTPYLHMTRIDALYDLPQRRKETAALYAAFAQANPAHPLSAQALYMAAMAALGQEDYAAARSHADAFLARHAPHELTPSVLFVAAEAAALPAANGSGGSVEQAEKLYRQLVEKSPTHPRAARAQVRIGWCLLQLKKYDEAAKHLAAIAGNLQDKSLLAEAHLLAGRAHSAAGRAKEAMTAFEAARGAKPDSSRIDEILLAAAESLRAAGQLDTAAARLDELIRDRPKSPLRAQALFQRGEIAQEQNKQEVAIGHFREVVKASPKSEFAAPASYRLAAALYARGDDPAALDALKPILPGNADAGLIGRATFLRGLIYLRQKKYEPALKDLEAFLAGHPTGDEQRDARLCAALCQVQLGRVDQATATASALVQANPGYAALDKLYYELGYALLEKKRLAEAGAAFATLAEKWPDSPLAVEGWFHAGRAQEETAEKANSEPQKNDAYAKAAAAYAAGLAKARNDELREKFQYKLGDVQFRLKQFDQAAQTLLQQLQDHAQGKLAGPARFLAAESLFRQNQFDKALPLFERVVADKLEPYLAQARYRAGTCANNQKQWPALIAAYPKYEQIHDVRYGLALALQNQGKLNEARTLCERLVKDTDGEAGAKACFMLGEMAFADGKYAAAVEQFLTVAAGYPFKDMQALGRFEAGRCLIELGQKPKAIESLQMVVDQFPDHPRAKDAARLIDELKSKSP